MSNERAISDTSPEVSQTAVEQSVVKNTGSSGSAEVDYDDWGAEQELSIIQALKFIFSVSGLTYSDAAIRDLPDVRHEVFGPKAAVSALSNAGHSSGFGSLRLNDLTNPMCPAIAFTKGYQAVVIKNISSDETVEIIEFVSDVPTNKIVQRSELDNELLSYIILARRLDRDAKSEKSGDWFWGAFKQSKSIYAQIILAALLTNFLGLATSIFIMVVYDRVVPNQATESLIVLTIGVLLALAFEFVMKMLRGKFIDNAGRKADSRMARLIFEKILSIRPDSQKQNSGAMASMVREFDTLREFFASATLIAVVDLPFIFLFVWVISLIAGPLATVPLVAVPMVILSGLLIQPFLSRIAESNMKSGMSKQSVLIETLSGLETIQATGSGPLMRQRFEKSSNTQSDLSLRSRTLSQMAVNSTASIMQFSQVGTIVYGVFLIQDGTITMGAMIAAMILGGRSLSPLGQLTTAMARANAAKSAYHSINRLMQVDSGAHATEPRPRLSRPKMNGEIEFKNVTYTFPGSKQPAIKNLSFKIPAGQKVAVLGRMGSGKSTLARLLCGLIEPTSGSVLIDGVDVRQIDRADLRRNVGVMLQESWLFSGTLRENLQMGFYEYSADHLLTIAKLSGVDDFVSVHPEGYDMLLRERGEGLSGGQRQSINLARALLHSPNILILDEPTSSMDSATEQAVLSNLKAECEKNTMVMITHRNSILDLANRVFVMDQGAIIADTTPGQIRKK